MKLYGYKVFIDQYCTHSEHSGEQFGSWEESFSNSFDHIEAGSKYPDVTSPHEFKDGEVGYLVWVEYSTGDSFGRSDRGRVESVALFKNVEDAMALKAAMDKHKWNIYWGTKEEVKDFSFTASDGQVIEYKNNYAPWTGYFESLNDVNVSQFTFGVKFK